MNGKANGFIPVVGNYLRLISMAELAIRCGSFE
jgi:hypothetical protein